MPKSEKKSTLLRQWEMMRELTVSRSDSKQEGRWEKASKIAEKLNGKGYRVSVRTVQRDLLELVKIFPIDLNDKNPRDYGWRWRKGSSLNIPGMSISEALAMGMVEIHLKQLLPASMLDGLQSVFSLAQTKLANAEKQNSNHAKDWLNKVRIVPPAQPLLAPQVDQEVQANLYQALLENRQITAKYQPMSCDQPKEYLLHPLGFIMRGSVSYIVASAWDYSEVQLYALHRFSEVVVLSAAVNAPEGFNLDKAIVGGLADFANQGEPIRLEIRCTEWVAAYLAETPLSGDQKTEQETDGWIRLTATVNDTWQLRWWLLGQGAGLEVCSPRALREEIKAALIEMVRLYGGVVA